MKKIENKEMMDRKEGNLEIKIVKKKMKDGRKRGIQDRVKE